MYKDNQVAEMLQEKDDKISEVEEVEETLKELKKWWKKVLELEKEIVSLNTYVEQLENRLFNDMAEFQKRWEGSRQG